MKLFYCLMILLCPFWSPGQMASGFAPLKIGERVPDVELRTVLNAPYTATSLAAFDDQLLIVDFWATWCASCIREFPKLDSLQSQFKGRIQVLLVNNPGSGDDEKKLTSFLERKRNPSGRKYNMAIVIHDSALAELLPHITIPHTAWIYKGKLLAVTEAESVTAANIEAILQGRQAELEGKADQVNFDYHKPLLENGNGGSTSALLYRSVFTRYLKGAGGAVGQDISLDSSWRRKYYINKPLISLYSFAFPKLPTNRVLLSADLIPLLLTNDPNIKWQTGHSFCYEQTLPLAASSAQQQRAMQLDLDRQFSLYSRLEKRAVQCYVLLVKDTALLERNRSNTAPGSLAKNRDGYWVLINAPVGQLITEINYQPPLQPFIPVILDETGYAAPVTIELKLKDIHDIASLQKILPVYGLELVPVTREIEMLVISSSTHPKTN